MTERIDTITACVTQLMDVMDEVHRNDARPDVRRHVALAKTAFEEGQMWAEAALTTKPLPTAADLTTDVDTPIA